MLSLGRLGTKELAASALTTMLCNTTGVFVGQGMASALDTLCSQAYTGSQDKTILGKHLQRAIVNMFLLFIPISLIWSNAQGLFLALGQDPEIAALSGVLARWMIPGLFPLFVGDCLKRFLQAQGIVKPTMYITMLVSPLNMFLQWLLVWSPYQIGIIGAPIATSISNTLIPVLLIIYVGNVQGRECWGGWEWKEALDLNKIYQQVQLGVPGMIMLCAETWAFEIVALAAGLFGDTILAAQTVVLNITSFLYMEYLGLSVAASTRTGNSLGANEPDETRNIAYTGLIVSVLLATLNASALYVFRDSVGYLFTSDPQVIATVASVVPLAALYQISDGLKAVGQGILTGCRHQKTGAIINISAYYLFALPAGLFLAFYYKMGLLGLWTGLTGGLFVVSAVATTIILRLNWEKEAQKAQELL